ncbi:tRNA wybutosine-synthesizing 2 3 4 [Olea europaea subsp. europaea]|uniref:tRNA wybutosine-synthesizing protein 3 n=1 Tax=Olea europaea subsp. europaea TaxID=158383 RepID=A0A8S0TXP1_OLEEU|nr:tRNA wybutosine-synthesizing 2 3 4 [Olea europaea subsp. europaea]
MDFEKRKAVNLAAMTSPEPDKSPKGNIDTPIIPLLTTINSHPSYFTTSSCSGRISVLAQPIDTAAAAATTVKKKAKGGTWVFVSHDPVPPFSILPLLFSSSSNESPPRVATESDNILLQSLVFRFEPLIIAVECKDIEAAQSLISLAISCGFRESGITSASKRVIIAIRCSIRLEVPLGDTLKLMVSPEYVEYLVGVANEKMVANRKRTDLFLNSLLKNGFSRDGIYMNGKIDSDGGDMCRGNQKAASQGNPFGDSCVEEDLDSEKKDFDDIHCGSQKVLGINLSVIEIIGEPVERLFLWGHSGCMVDQQKILIFAGFGGIGRHARRNDLLLLDPECGMIEAIHVQGAPCPRLGHTSSVVGGFMYVIGGRADPLNILNDVWVFNMAKKEWNLLQCSGCHLPPRHRHAAAVVGTRIYVHGGICKDEIISSLYVLDTYKAEWTEIEIQGNLPSPRHSHSMDSHGSNLYTFGGFNGEKALGDLYSFDVRTCLWSKQKTNGKAPKARFSHSMFIYKNYLGIFGGCPVSQNHELSLLDLQSYTWKHIMVNSIDGLFVRSTVNVVGDSLILIGGGASCFAFGTKFSEPMKVNLSLLTSLDDNFTPTKIGEESRDSPEEETIEGKNANVQYLHSTAKPKVNGHINQNAHFEEPSVKVERQMVAVPCILQLGKQHAKLVKDILKRFGWLDIERKVYSREDGMFICFPVTEKFCTMFEDKQKDLGDSCKVVTDLHSPRPSCLDILSQDISISESFKLLIACGATKLVDEVVKNKKTPNTPHKMMKEEVASLLNSQGLPPELLEQLPSRWERLGDIVVLPVTSFKDPLWDSVGKELWPLVAKSLGALRLARQAEIAQTGTRDSKLKILVGDDGWVDHRENGILYSFDATKCMFSWGNLSEKLRMGSLDCRNDVIVDLFSGIGYFTLPFLVRANAKFVYACEWNPDAVEALHRNLQANSVADRCTILEGDNRVTAPKVC